MKLNELPVGSLIKDSYGVGTQYNGQYIVWRVLEHGHTGDPTGSTALECRDIITCKVFDAKEPNNPDSNRSIRGNNRYKFSNALQWLNSDKDSGWYTAQHDYDASPDSSTSYANKYASEAGFLTNFSAELKKSLMEVSKTTVICTTDGGGSESVTSRVFLLSTTEIGLTNENNIAEGSIYALYNADSTKRKKIIINSAAVGGVSSQYAVVGSNGYWWLRTPNSTISFGERAVDNNGNNQFSYAHAEYPGLSPAICIPSDLEVALDTTDNVYYIVWPTVPDIKKIYVNNNGVTKCIENRDLVHPFATATDIQLKAMLDAYYADEITWAEMGWNVGDTRLIHLNSMTAPSPYSGNWDAQDITVVIVAHDHTDLATPINGHTKACITVQTREVMNNCTASENDTAHHIYYDGTSSKVTSFIKWSNLYLRTYLNNTVFGAIPTGDFKSAIKQSNHYWHTTYNGTASEQVADTLFVPVYPEIYGTTSYTKYVATSPVEGTQFPYYETSANRIKYGNNNGVANNVACDWWEGSASSEYSSTYGYYFCDVNSDGTADRGSGSSCRGLAPAWCM